MIFTIYKRALAVLLKKPFALWGISLLEVLLTAVVTVLFGAIPGLALGINLLRSTSMTMIFLHGYRGDGVKSVQLFDCFKDGATAKRVLGGMLWMELWTFLWGLIPIVGPIFALIRTYEYRLTPYILVYEPEVPITEAIKISAQKTKGYKLQMWLADFVWGLVFGAAVLVLSLLALIPVLGVLFALAMIVLYIAVCALAPLFVGLVQAAFYVEITSEAVGFCSGCGFKLTSEVENCPNCGRAIR